MKYYGWGLYFRLVWRTLTAGRDSFGRWTWRRLLIMPWFMPLFGLLQLEHRLCFLLDDIFFRGYRNIAVKEPVFIIGIPRSGTTFLHRCLSRDDRFTLFTTWELILAPSITQRKVYRVLGRIDRLFGRPFQRLILLIESHLLNEMNRMHETGLYETEEDFQLFNPIFSCILLLVPFPFPDLLYPLARFDTEIPADQRQHIMRFHRRCLQRHLYVHGADKRILSKNPTFSTMVEGLRETYPDAHIACCVRRPDEALVSMLSLVSYFWQVFGNAKRGHDFRDIVLDLAAAFYRHPMERLPAWPPERAQFVRYDDLAKAPGDTVRGMYDHFGLDVPPALEEYLAELDAKAASYRSPHKYAPENFDLTAQQIYQDFKDVYERFDFSPPDGHEEADKV
ncbi:MAG: sulfotransferase family protein [Candidatus Hydrogenedentota bacterium]